MCGSGYLHGVIEEKLGNSPHIFKDMFDICPQTNASKCYHGVGHGFMYYTDNNLPQSIALCDKFDNQQARTACGEGVFMENFNTDRKSHPSFFLSEDNPFYPCGSQDWFYKSICYFYAPSFFLSLHKNEYLRTLTWCKTAETYGQLTCDSGVGSRAMKQNIHDPKFVEKICSNGTDQEVKACLDGMVSYYLVNYGSVEKGKQMCGTLAPEHMPTCLTSVTKRRELFFE